MYFVYIPGEKNTVADALSRYPQATLQQISVLTPGDMGLLHWARHAAKADERYQQRLSEVQDASTDEASNGGFTDWDGLILTPEGRIEVPNHDILRTTILAESHDIIVSGHFGVEKTLEKVLRYWTWRGVARDVRRYVATCATCQKMKHQTQKPWGLCQPILAPYPWHTVTLDLVGKFEPARESGHTYCLVMVDKFSKFVLLQDVPEACDAKMVADIFLKRVVSTFGVPVKVISDRGPQFTAQLWHQILENLGIQVAHATSHHPQTDGQSERTIQTFLRLLRTFTSKFPESWVEKLPFLQFALNDAYVEATKSTPFRVVFGRDPTPPLAALRDSAPAVPESGNGESEEGGETPLHYSDRLQRELQHVYDFIREHQQMVAARMKERFDANRRSPEWEGGYVSTYEY